MGRLSDEKVPSEASGHMISMVTVTKLQICFDLSEP